MDGLYSKGCGEVRRGFFVFFSSTVLFLVLTVGKLVVILKCRREGYRSWVDRRFVFVFFILFVVVFIFLFKRDRGIISVFFIMFRKV